jgi:hypothetical protein
VRLDAIARRQISRDLGFLSLAALGGGTSDSDEEEEELNCNHGGSSPDGREELAPDLNGAALGFKEDAGTGVAHGGAGLGEG